jgi:sigma-B regulation protein RsbU (phosphoserine phosphatase)
MLTRTLQSLRQEYRAHAMVRFAAWTLAYGVALEITSRLSGGVPGLLWLLFWGSAIASGLYGISRLIRLVKDRVLWRLSRRLAVTYVFIAVIPVVLILALVALAVTMINGQFAAYLVTLKLRDQVDELRQVNRVIAHEAHMSQARTPGALLAHLKQLFSAELEQHAAAYPGLEITVHLGSQARAYLLDGTPLARPVGIPAWFKKEEFAGVVDENGRLFLRSMDHGSTPVGDLTVILTQPFTPQLLDLVGAGVGPVGVLVPQPPPGAPPLNSAPRPKAQIQRPPSRALPPETITSNSVPLPAPMGFFDLAVLGASALDPVVWGGAVRQPPQAPVFVYVRSRLSTLNRRLLGTLGVYSHVYVTVFIVIAVALLVIELLSLVMGLRLTRSITGTVNRLYDATERVKAGDFSYRIGLPARDQLGALGEAFDTMTASVERLLRESQEKTRLQNELEIARQVQQQLFPHAIPKVPGLELYGTCIPARGVSGDYYDFLQVGSGHLVIVLADVSGKGISAALLMAAIQSAIRAQLYASVSVDGGEGALLSTAEVVRRLSQQFYETTPEEKYATFFYAVYDPATRWLTYTNAGHPAPMLFRGAQVERLEVGGTAIGLFPDSRFSQGKIRLDPGDLLLAFTDGITEPQNSFEEEFGEHRVVETVLRAGMDSPDDLTRQICQSANDWTGSPELQDDMTLIIGRATP